MQKRPLSSSTLPLPAAALPALPFQTQVDTDPVRGEDADLTHAHPWAEGRWWSGPPLGRGHLCGGGEGGTVLGNQDLSAENLTLQFVKAPPARAHSSLATLRLLSPHTLRWIWKGLLRPFPRVWGEDQTRPQSSHGPLVDSRLQTSVLRCV